MATLVTPTLDNGISSRRQHQRPEITFRKDLSPASDCLACLIRPDSYRVDQNGRVWFTSSLQEFVTRCHAAVSSRQADLVRRCSCLQRTDRLKQWIDCSLSLYKSIIEACKYNLFLRPTLVVECPPPVLRDSRYWLRRPTTPNCISQSIGQAGTSPAFQSQPISVLDLCSYQPACHMLS